MSWGDWFSNKNKENILMGSPRMNENELSRLEALEETVAKLVQERKSAEMEWAEMYERFRLLYARLSKRVKQLDQSPEPQEDTAAQVGGGGAGPHTSLTARQIEANNRILAIRRRGGGGGA